MISDGGKGLFAASDDHAAHAVIGIEHAQRFHQFGHQRAVEGVERLRPVELYNADAVFLAHKDVFVIWHFRYSPYFSIFLQKLPIATKTQKPQKFLAELSVSFVLFVAIPFFWQ
ncbi:MAG: hypothetical protein R2911_24100 [Caldilineaceae bacterium]